MNTRQDGREWAEQLATTVDPERLVARLVEAGWASGAGRPGIWVQLRWPGSDDKLRVPLDRTAPEHTLLMAAVLVQLEWAVERGRAAQQVLDGLTPPDS